MSKKTYDDFDVLDDYYEEEGDSFLFNQAMGSDLSNVSYDDFNKAKNDYDDYDDDDEVVYVEEKPVRHTTKVVKKNKKIAIEQNKIKNF